MKKTIRLLIVLMGIASATVLGSQFAQASEGKECSHEMMEGHHHCHHWRHMRHHRFEKMAAKLGLSEQQKLKIKEIFKQNREQAKPIFYRLLTEKRNMRALVMADKTNEAAIRAEATKIAAVEGDMAVHRAHMIQQMRAVLTPEQRTKLKAMKKEWESKSEKFHHHSGEKSEKTGAEQQ